MNRKSGTGYIKEIYINMRKNEYPTTWEEESSKYNKKMGGMKKQFMNKITGLNGVYNIITTKNEKFGN